MISGSATDLPRPAHLPQLTQRARGLQRQTAGQERTNAEEKISRNRFEPADATLRLRPIKASFFGSPVDGRFFLRVAPRYPRNCTSKGLAHECCGSFLD